MIGSLRDIVIDETRLRGRSTAGHMVTGVVRQILPGICFRVNDGSAGSGGQESYLWRDYAIVGARKADDMDLDLDLDQDPPPAPALRRTDSGADYGMAGYPDCEFWERMGPSNEPLFVAPHSLYYNRGPRDSKVEVASMLQYSKDAAEELGGAYLRAWRRQAETVMHMTPPRLPAAEPVCPPAPARAIKTNTLELHRGAGILPGDFIKPDPAMTQRETRQYVLAELQRWLTAERICTHAKEIAVADILGMDLVAHLAEGTWPAARLYMVLKTLERENNVVLPGDYEERFRFVGTWAAGICSDYLEGRPLETPCSAASMALGFVQTDKLPSGVVIESFWNYSPFGALRSAPPLSELVEPVPLPMSPVGTAEDEAAEELEEEAEAEDDEEADEDEDEDEEELEEELEEEDEEADEAEVKGQETFQVEAYAFLSQDYTITLPGWAIGATATAVGLYLLVVNAALSRVC